MSVENFLNSKSLTSHVGWKLILPALTVVLVLASNYYVFAVVPNERVMGAVQRIFYFHVGAAMAAYLALGILFAASCFYLASKKVAWDAVADSSASVAFLFSSVVLASGMIWGHSAWNTWWRWEPRLVSFLVLWLLLLSYRLLRGYTERDFRGRNFAAVLGILCALNVPVVIYSIKLLDHSEQLHPQVVANQGLRDASFVVALVLGNLSMLALSVWLMKVKATNILLQEEIRLVGLRLSRVARRN